MQCRLRQTSQKKITKYITANGYLFIFIFHFHWAKNYTKCIIYKCFHIRFWKVLRSISLGWMIKFVLLASEYLFSIFRLCISIIYLYLSAKCLLLVNYFLMAIIDQLNDKNHLIRFKTIISINAGKTVENK